LKAPHLSAERSSTNPSFIPISRRKLSEYSSTQEFN